jgi:hypothetical protein
MRGDWYAMSALLFYYSYLTVNGCNQFSSSPCSGWTTKKCVCPIFKHLYSTIHYVCCQWMRAENCLNPFVIKFRRVYNWKIEWCINSYSILVFQRDLSENKINRISCLAGRYIKCQMFLIIDSRIYSAIQLFHFNFARIYADGIYVFRGTCWCCMYQHFSSLFALNNTADECKFRDIGSQFYSSYSVPTEWTAVQHFYAMKFHNQRFQFHQDTLMRTILMQ